jgi:hypothetical protein
LLIYYIALYRFSLQKDKYQVIKTPRLDNLFSHPTFTNSSGHKKDIIPHVYLGKSRQGIYYTALYKNHLRVWLLREASDSHAVPAWEMKHQATLESSFTRHYSRHCTEEEIDESWNLDRGDQKGPSKDGRDHEWDSDNDSVVDVGGGEDGDEEVGSIIWDVCENEKPNLLGFHPHKEIIFFGKEYDGFAYYLSSSKLEYLGSFRPIGDRHNLEVKTQESFIYTPCMYDMLPEDGDSSDDLLGYGDYNVEEEDDDDDDDGDLEWM